MERGLVRVGLREAIFPGPLEINGVRHDEAGLVLQHAGREEIVNFSIGLFGDPLVDRLP